MAIVAVAAVAVRAIPATAVAWVSPDAVEYFDIARRMGSGEGFTLSIKAYHYVPGPLVHYAGWDRPFLFPALLSLVWRLAPSPIALQLANVAFGTLGALLAFGLARAVHGLAAAFWAGMLMALAPRLVASSWYLWTEPLALALTLGAAWAFLSGESSRRMALAGLLQGAAFLARPASTALLGLMALFVLMGRAPARQRAIRLAALLAGFSVAASIQVGLNLAHGAPPLTTAQSFLYRTLRFSDGMFFDYGGHWSGSARDTVREHAPEIAREIRRNAREYARLLLKGRQGIEWLGLFSLAIPLILWRLARGRLARPETFLLLAGLLALAFHILTWSTRDPDRFLQIPFAFLLILAVGELFRLAVAWQRAHPRAGAWMKGGIHFGALAMALLYLPPSIRDARESLRRHGSDWPMMGIFSANWRNDDALALHEWLRSNTAPGDALASTNPWALAWHTGRPAVLLPYEMPRETLARFLEDFGVQFVILNFEHPPPAFNREPDYRKDLIAMGAGDAERVGSYWIHAVGPAATKAGP